jgi:hypothetical protein
MTHFFRGRVPEETQNPEEFDSEKNRIRLSVSCLRDHSFKNSSQYLAWLFGSLGPRKEVTECGKEKLVVGFGHGLNEWWCQSILDRLSEVHQPKEGAEQEIVARGEGSGDERVKEIE